MSLTLDDIRAAHARIADAVHCTPCMDSDTLSQITGAQVFVKFENLQYTASFKERGALNKLLGLDDTARRTGVIAISAGNHAQGVAYHAQRLGIPATIVMPEPTPFVKVQHTEEFGARVVQSGETIAEGRPEAQRIAEAEGLTWVHPFDDEAVIAGQGTVALEMLVQAPDLDVLVAPIGGGGLIAGMATAATALKPGIEVIGVQAERYPSARDALDGRTATYGGATVAEGIAVKTPGTLTLPIIRDKVADVVLVGEDTLEAAINLYFAVEKTVAEGAGAAALAALLAHPDRFRGRRVGLVLSGGNIDSRLMATVIMRGLVREGQIARIRVVTADTPGQLARVAQLIADAGGNIVEVDHQRLLADVALKSADIDITLEARDRHHLDAVIAALGAAGYKVRVLSD
ncbi:MAG: threonine ammonia-lyase [Rhodospirillaceae bacterium]